MLRCHEASQAAYSITDSKVLISKFQPIPIHVENNNILSGFEVLDMTKPIILLLPMLLVLIPIFSILI